MAEHKRKEKVSRGFTARIAALFTVILIGLSAAHFLGIFTFEDWKELFGESNPIHTEGTAEVHFIDVGQGDCTFVISDGKTLLIDTGEKEYAQKICEYIGNQGIDKIDYMLLSHPHSDHMGGASEIIDNIDVENIILPKLPYDMNPTSKFYESFLLSVKNNGLKLTAALPGSIYEIGECKLEILSPVNEYSDLNNFSAAAVLTHGADSFLFTGDIEKKSEKDIIETGRLSQIDVLKAAHHGSSTSNSREFLEITDPDYAVIMCSQGNSYNHPNKDAVERIRKHTDRIYRTDLDGTIVFTSSEDGLKIKTEKGE